MRNISYNVYHICYKFRIAIHHFSFSEGKGAGKAHLNHSHERESDKEAEQSYEKVTSEQRRREHEVSTEGSNRESMKGA